MIRTPILVLLNANIKDKKVKPIISGNVFLCSKRGKDTMTSHNKYPTDAKTVVIPIQMDGATLTALNNIPHYSV